MTFTETLAPCVPQKPGDTEGFTSDKRGLAARSTASESSSQIASRTEAIVTTRCIELGPVAQKYTAGVQERAIGDVGLCGRQCGMQTRWETKDNEA